MHDTEFLPLAAVVANPYSLSVSAILFLKIFLTICVVIAVLVVVLGFFARLVLDLFGIVDEPSPGRDDRYA